MHEYSANHAEGVARAVFAGLVPSTTTASATAATTLVRQASDRRMDRDPGRLARGVFNTVPIVLVGSLAAMTFNLTGPIDSANAKPIKKGDATQAGGVIKDSARPAQAGVPTALAAPATYSVSAGDTVSDIATRFGLSTASVLALNGLSWSSLIFPGQQLKLGSGDVTVVDEPAGDPTPSGQYTIVSGDTISAIAARFGVSTFSVLAANNLGWSSIIYPGQALIIPGLVGPGTPAPQPGDAGAPTIDDGRQDGDPSVPSDATPVAAQPSPDAPAAPAAPAPVATGTSYTIQPGETLSGIAAKFGISTQDLLDANGLDWSSVIFGGHTLVIPGISQASYGGSVAVLGDDSRANASTIIQVGRSLGVPDYGIVIALATAMQESSMRNINWGDLDSVGLFQQRPSAGWGSVDLLTTPSYAAALFYGGPSNPNAGNTRGLLDIPGWESMSVSEAAQRVQISAYPDAYAKWESSARAWLAELG